MNLVLFIQSTFVNLFWDQQVHTCIIHQKYQNTIITYCKIITSQAKKVQTMPISTKLPLILPKDTNLMTLVQALSPSVALDQNLMPPPPTQENAADDTTNKKQKIKGMYTKYHKTCAYIILGWLIIGRIFASLNILFCCYCFFSGRGAYYQTFYSSSVIFIYLKKGLCLK